MRIVPRKILFLEHNVDGTVGGSHVCLLGICRHLDRSVFIPIVCFYQDNALVPRFRELGVEVLILQPFKPVTFALSKRGGLFRGIGFLQSMVNFARMVLVRPWSWVALLRRAGVDAVHLNNSCGGDVDLVFAAKFLRVPVIAHQRGFPPGFGRFERAVARTMERIIAVSDVVKDHLVERGVSGPRVVRIHDGIEIEQLQQGRPPEELRQELGIDIGRPVVGMLGNIKWWKGQQVLVDAMPSISNDFPNVCFLFVGKVADEPYKQALDERIRSFGLESNVMFIGYRPDATDLIALMDVIVHASVEPEPFGLVVLEAMGKGKPIVATDLGGPKETVVNGVTGFLFSQGDPQSLAECVRRLLANPEVQEKVGRAGAEHVYKHFSAQRNAHAISRLYAEVFNL